MTLRVQAVYENGVLKPLQPLDLPDKEQVALTIDFPGPRYEPDYAYVDTLRESLRDAGPAPGLEEVRRRLSKITGSLTAEFIAEREDH